MHATLAIQVRPVRQDIAVLDIQGDLTGSAETTLTEAHSQASNQGAQMIILNFSALEYMNSSGIGLLVTLLIRANRAKQRLRACGLSEHYRQILDLTRLSDVVGIYPNEADAIQAR
jgi:anti-sigma B factor antagonist